MCRVHSVRQWLVLQRRGRTEQVSLDLKNLLRCFDTYYLQGSDVIENDPPESIWCAEDCGAETEDNGPETRIAHNDRTVEWNFSDH